MSFLFDTQPLVINKDLSAANGFSGALVLQQVRYWLEGNWQANRNGYGGRYWTDTAISEWQDQFSFFSYSTVKRTLKKLHGMGIPLTGNYNRKKIGRTSWCSMDYGEFISAQSRRKGR